MGDDGMKNTDSMKVINLVGGGTVMKNFAKTAILTALAAVMFAGCAQDVGTIDRVKDNYVKKFDLLYNQTAPGRNGSSA